MSLLKRAKDVVGWKVGDVKKTVKKEVEYQTYKRPNLGYVATGKKSTDADYSSEFAKRKARSEDIARIRREEKRRMLKEEARARYNEMQQQRQQAGSEARQTGGIFSVQPNNDFFSSSGTSEVKGFDPLGGLGPKKGKKEFSIW